MAQLQNNTLKLENIEEAKTIVVTYSKIKFTVTKQTTQNGITKLSKTSVEWGSSFTATFSCPQDLDFTNSDLRAYIASGFNKTTNQVLLVPVKDIPENLEILDPDELDKEQGTEGKEQESTDESDDNDFPFGF